MAKDKKIFTRFISFILSIIISITLTSVNYASEVDKKDSTETSNLTDTETNEALDENLEQSRPQLQYDERISETHIPYVYGSGSIEFNPNQHISRQEAFTLLLRVIEIIETDKTPQSYSTDQIVKELENRKLYVTEYQKNNLRAQITRTEVARLVNDYLQLSSVDTKLIARDIHNSLDKEFIENIINHFIMSLDKNGNFNPDKNVTRAEIITILNKIQNRIVDKSSIKDIPQIYKDVPKSHWAYGEILEATVLHSIDVNTKEQKWTNYTLTDIDKEKIKETSNYNNTVGVLIKNGLKNPNKKQIEAIEKMNKYISDNNRVKKDFDSGKTLIFAFEGAGDYNNKWSKTSYHNEGRYGAMFIVIKNKEVAYITTNGSTLPDNSTKNINIYGTLKKVRTLDSQRENISNYRSGNHKSYPGLIPYNISNGSENKSQKVKSLEGRAENGFRMNIHSGRSIEKPMSDGCLTIRDTDYINFAKKVGYMPNWVDNNKNNFDSITRIGTGKFVPNVVVTLVLDRTLMDGSTKSKFWKN